MMSGGAGQRLGIKPGSNRAGMVGVSVRLVRVKFTQDLRREVRCLGRKVPTAKSNQAHQTWSKTVVRCCAVVEGSCLF